MYSKQRKQKGKQTITKERNKSKKLSVLLGCQLGSQPTTDISPEKHQTEGVFLGYTGIFA